MAIAALGLTAFETASLATAAVGTGVAVAGAAASAKQASNQATAATQVANYNANLDIAQAQQSAANANANIAKARTDNAAFDSAQRAAYASSGILSGTGSPMALQATTAGRQEQDIQQAWSNEQESETSEYSAAQYGVYEGAEQASAYHLEGASDIFQGIGSVSKIVGPAVSQYNEYEQSQTVGAD